MTNLLVVTKEDTKAFIAKYKYVVQSSHLSADKEDLVDLFDSALNHFGNAQLYPTLVIISYPRELENEDLKSLSNYIDTHFTKNIEGIFFHKNEGLRIENEEIDEDEESVEEDIEVTVLVSLDEKIKGLCQQYSNGEKNKIGEIIKYLNKSWQNNKSIDVVKWYENWQNDLNNGYVFSDEYEVLAEVLCTIPDEFSFHNNKIIAALAKATNEIYYLSQLQCYPTGDNQFVSSLKDELKDVPFTDYANIFKKYVFHHHELFIPIVYLYYYGICKEDIDGLTDNDMDIFQKMYYMAQILVAMKDEKERYDFICKTVSTGCPYALVFFSHNHFLNGHLKGEDSEISKVLRCVSSSLKSSNMGDPLTDYIYIKWCQIYYKYAPEEIKKILQLFIDKGNKEAEEASYSIFCENLPTPPDVEEFKHKHSFIKELTYEYVLPSSTTIDSLKNDMASLIEECKADENAPLLISFSVSGPYPSAKTMKTDVESILSYLKESKAIQIGEWGGFLGVKYSWRDDKIDSNYHLSVALARSDRMLIRDLHSGNLSLFKDVYNYLDTDNHENCTELVNLFIDRYKNGNAFDGETLNDYDSFANYVGEEYGKQLHALIVERAKNNDLDALAALHCLPSSLYSFGYYDFIAQPYTENVVRFVYRDACRKVEALEGLAVAFDEGIFLEQDKQMASILRKCFFNIMGANYGDIDGAPDFFGEIKELEPYWLNCEEEDKQYINEWLQTTAYSDKPYSEWAQDVLDEYFSKVKKKSISEIDDVQLEYRLEISLKQRHSQINNFEQNQDLDTLYQLGCLPACYKELDWLINGLQNLDIENYADFYKKYSNEYPEMFIYLAHLYDYGICRENLEVSKWYDMDRYQKLYYLCHTDLMYNNPKERFNYRWSRIEQGQLYWMFFLDNDLYMNELNQEEKWQIISSLYDKINDSGNCWYETCFEMLCERYIDASNHTDELMQMMKNFADDGHCPAANKYFLYLQDIAIENVLKTNEELPPF